MKNVPPNGKEDGHCITTMLPPTHRLFAEKNILLLHQPPYSPDLAPSDFWLCPKITMGLKGNRFDTVEVTKNKATAELRKIPQRTFIFVSSNGRSGGPSVCVLKEPTLKAIK
ncbi:hypothetical protein AVEN_114252-1 [Araneus ventricosus]|uniref:Tc1-like transposase DDE domain-containing protein n=1 Tax=Araneus ventricosus TaxID=182803 RepID=A0A4Y2MHH3_ARAVE|nr:hypothetical protein AVEN_114252-1 [Araneus ventricosus]